MDNQLIDHLASLCRIACTEEEKSRLAKNLSQIVEYIKQLEALDTDSVAPCSRVLETDKNVWRDDLIGETLPRETFLENSGSHIGGMVRTPPIIKF
jgi:aspartyl-tRNA(Asn)/glutamyl-tRNA(Gln) amidotransferase subunit C